MYDNSLTPRLGKALVGRRSRLWPRTRIVGAVAVGLMGLLGVTACADDPMLVEPTDSSVSLVHGNDEELPVVQPYAPVTAAQAGGHTIREEFADMARRVPGGFGGLFFDHEGVLNIVLRDLGMEYEARAALGRERMIQARSRGPHGHQFDVARARIHHGTYTYDELYDWYQRLLVELRVIPSMSSVRAHRNRIFVGIGELADRIEVDRAIQAARIPSQALVIEVVPDVQLLNSLRSQHRPVPGGVQIQYKTTQGDPRCTIGPNVIRLDQEGFLVNSHCTKAFGEVDWNDITHYWQHKVNSWWEQETTRHIGNEAIDPAVFPCLENPAHGCRNSDAALGLYNNSVDPDFGRIARPESRNTEALSISSNNPRFSITQTLDWSIDGETLEKVGRTTGWSGGQVFDGCVTVAETVDNTVVGPSIRCSMIVDALAGSGDSGAPVFRIISGNSVELRGTVWGGQRTDAQSCWWDPFPDIIKCPRFVANNLGGIKLDLDPNLNAPLQFFSTGGGGGGSGHGGDCDDPTVIIC